MSHCCWHGGYSAARAQSGNSAELSSEQRAWMARRNQCQTTACVSDAYSARLAEFDAGFRAAPTTTGQLPQTENATALSSATTNAAPAVPQQATAHQDEAQHQELSATRAAFVAACDRAMVSRQGAFQRTESFSMFAGSGRASRIHTLEEAVQKRKESLRIGVDAIDREIRIFQSKAGQNDEALRRGSAPPNMTADWNADKECFSRYVAFLQSIAAPSLETMRQEFEQASAAKIELQRQARESTQRAKDEADAEAARQQKEAAIVAAKVEVEATERAVRQAVQQQTEAATQHEELRLAREAAAKAATEANEEAQRQAEKLPTCTDDVVLEMVKDMVAASPAGKVVGLRITDFENPSQTALSGPPPVRHCYTQMLTTDGRNWGPYTIRWEAGGHERFVVEVHLSK